MLGQGRPFVAVKFSKKASSEVVAWFVDRVCADKLNYGCQLNVFTTRSGNATEPGEDGALLLVSGNRFRILAGAEIYGVRKRYKDGSMREFSIMDEENYENWEDDEFITDGEALYVIKSELDGLRALCEEDFVPGHEQVKLYTGESVLVKLISAGIVTDVFSLHDPTKLNKLAIEWYRRDEIVILDQPMEQVRGYFGDTIAVYFAFLGYYSKALIPLMIMSLPLYVLSINWNKVQTCTIFAMVNIIWAAVFLDTWKRRCAEMAYKFGTFQKREWEEPRGGFQGEVSRNPITGRQERSFPDWKRNLWLCFVTGPVVALCILAAIWLMFVYFSWDFYFAKLFDHSESAFARVVARNVPSIIYSVLVLVADSYYRKLAEYLTDKENHRLESSYQNHLIIKIVLFDFMNNFLCLFYIAFVYNDMKMLRMTLRNLFIIQIVLAQIFESIVPYWTYQYRSSSSRSSPQESHPPGKKVMKEPSDLGMQADAEIKRDIYVGTFDDYLELWLQFGYIVMFSCVFPFASFLAFLNNIVEVRSDAFKICNVFRRPHSMPTGCIGAWQHAFEIISYLGIISNCALIFQSQSFQSWFFTNFPSATNTTLLICFLFTEHILIAARFTLSAVIPDVPEKVNIAIAKMRYKSMQAVKLQRNASLHPSEIFSKSIDMMKRYKSKSDHIDDDDEENN